MRLDFESVVLDARKFGSDFATGDSMESSDSLKIGHPEAEGGRLEVTTPFSTCLASLVVYLELFVGVHCHYF